MGIVSWIFIGILAGGVIIFTTKARGLVRLGYIAASIIGSILGGVDVAYLYKSPGAVDGFSLVGITVAAIGALMACAIWRLFGPGRSSTPDSR